jgi:hypothetical protein
MLFLNSNAYSNIITLLANLVFTRVLILWGDNPFWTHASSHSCLCFSSFFCSCDYILQIAMSSFCINMLQNYIHLIIYSILLDFKHKVTKICTFINLLNFQSMNNHITNFLGIIGLYKFCVKFDFYRLI